MRRDSFGSTMWFSQQDKDDILFGVEQGFDYTRLLAP